MIFYLRINIIVLLFICGVSVVRSQVQLKGHYYLRTSNEYIYPPEVDNFTFSKNGTIVFERHTDLGRYYGIGKYSIIKDKLKIMFEDVSDSIIKYQSGSYKIVSERLVKDSILYELNLVADEGYVLSGSVIQLKGKNSDLKYISNEDGITLINLSKNELPISIKISYIGFETLNIYFNDSLSKKIIIFLREPPPSYYKKRRD